jgi:hypothetical protein
VLTLPRATPAEVDLVEDGGTTVLRVRAASGAGGASHGLSAAPAATPRLSWRWKVDRALDRAVWGARSGDDFAARVYVAFDFPLDRLTFVERAKLRLARFVYGDDVPAAAICYVWATGVAVGTSGWNPYASRVRMIALRSGNERAGQWVDEARDVERDFRAAFGESSDAPVPGITGLALSSDTDQTLESATAWFGDLRLGPRP